jgi:hypothetical protein
MGPSAVKVPVLVVSTSSKRVVEVAPQLPTQGSALQEPATRTPCAFTNTLVST